MDEDLRALMEAAKRVLDKNWTGAYTRPASPLYPHQWSWDAAFIALAYAHYAPERARQELLSLFRGQWANGMLPHVVYHEPSESYFPNAAFWQTECCPYAPQNPPTTGLIQPPFHATAARHVYLCGPDPQESLAFLEKIYPKLRAWHEYLYRERDPGGEGLIYIRHPWESGQDNSPIWDRVLARIRPTPDQIPKYPRKDLQIVSAEERPEPGDYDRYMFLIRLFRDRDWDEARMQADCPFLVQDVAFNTLLVQANRDLAEIARALGEDPAPFEAWAAATTEAMNEKLWDEGHGIYLDYDLRAGEQIDVHVAGGFTPLYAGVPDGERAMQLFEALNSHAFCALSEECYAVPSYDRGGEAFSPARYWRGPVWINMNWLIYQGLRRYGFDEYARKVRQAVIELPQTIGFYEYFDPEGGKGYGASDFSWTAALVLEVLFEEQMRGGF